MLNKRKGIVQDNIVSPVGYPVRLFLDNLGCLVRWETGYVTFWVNFDQNNTKEGRPKLDKINVKGQF